MLRSTLLVLLFSLTAVAARASTSDVVALTSALNSGAYALQLVPTTMLLAEAEKPSGDTKNVTVTTAPVEHNFMLTIAANMAGGALVGFLLGGAVYLMQEPGNRAGVNIGWWTGGGAIVGLVAGVVQVVVTSNRDTKAVSDRMELRAPVGRQMVAWAANF